MKGFYEDTIDEGFDNDKYYDKHRQSRKKSNKGKQRDYSNKEARWK